MPKKRKLNARVSPKNKKSARSDASEKKKKIRVEDYIIKWKKKSKNEIDVYVASSDGQDTIYLGKTVYDIFEKKWGIDLDFIPSGCADAFEKTNEKYYSEIEAGRVMKRLWVKTRNFIDFSKHIDSGYPVYTKGHVNVDNAHGSGDGSLTDEEWESLISDISLNGD